MRQHLHSFLLVLIIVILHTTHSTAQIYTMNGSPISTCTGFFMDSGGGANNYGLNEDFTTVICSNGTEGTHIQLQFSSIDIGSGETFVVYDDNGPTPGTELSNIFLQNPNNPFTLQATAANNTGCLTIVFTSDGVDENNAGWSADINCIASCQTILSELVSTSPAVMPVDTGWIDICPGDRVEFSGTGIYPQNGIVYNHSNLNSSFEWTFGDGNSAVGLDVTNVFEEPGGYIVQLKITDQFGCENTNFISQRVRVSTYPTYVFDGTLNPSYCSGDTISITSSIDTSTQSNVSVFPNQGSFQQTLVVSNPLQLPDGTGVSYEETLSFTQFRPGAVLTNPDDIIGVSLMLEHSFAGDLDIELICPDGSSVYILDQGVGASPGTTNFGEPFASSAVDGQSFDLTLGIPYTYTFVNNTPNGTLDDFANGADAPTYTYTTVPSTTTGLTFTYTDQYFPAGFYEPEHSFDALLGCPLNGDWTIRVQDNLMEDNGWMTEWSMTFADYLYPNLETFTPNFVDWGWDVNPTVITSDQNGIIASPSNAGVASYSFWVLDDYGCVNDSTLTFDILPPTHPDCYTCDIQVNELEDVVLCEGDVTNLDACPTTGLEDDITFERFPDVPIGRTLHPHDDPYRSTLNINNIAPATITNPLVDIVSVCVNLNTDFLSDINISLEAPDGSILALAIANGGTAYTETCFVPTSINDINSGTSPYTGDFQPEGNWSDLIGSPINGDWHLLVSDGFGPQFGTLISWSITFHNVNEYTYSWSPSSGLSCNDCCDPVANPTTSTVYTLEIEDIYGCTQSQTINVGVIEDLSAPVVSCIAGDENIQFSWNPILGVVEFEYNITINNVEQGWVGPYSDTALSIDNLTNGDQVTLVVRPYFSNNVNNCPIPEGGSSSCTFTSCTLVVDAPLITEVSCFGETDGRLEIQIQDGIPPYSYQISGDPVVYTNPVFENLAAGMYTYTIIDGMDCELSINFEIPTPPLLSATATQTFISCFGTNESQAEVIPTGGTGADYTYLWPDGQTTALANNLTAGLQSVQIMDGNGCITNADVTIEQLMPIQFNLSSSSPTCENFADGILDINQVSGGIGLSDADYTYIWEDTNVDAMQRTDVLGGLAYTVTVRDAQGCEATESIQVNNPQPVSFSLQMTPPSCFQFADGSAEVINVNGPNGNNFTYQWDALTGNQQTAAASNLVAGTYSVIVTDDLGCMASNTINITQPQEIEVDFSIKNNDCFGGSDATIQTSIVGGTPIYTYSWQGGQVSSSLENINAGSYSLTVTDSKGCQAIKTATVTEPPNLTATIEVTGISCFGERDGMLNILPEGGVPPYQFKLSSNDFFITNTTIIGLEAGNYGLLIKDANDCEFSTNTTLESPDELMVDAGIDLEILFGDSIKLEAIVTNAQGMVDYVWGEPYEGTLSCKECPNPYASPEFTIDYEIYVIDENGCFDTDLLRVFVNKPKLVAVPTGFTPNGDLINDELFVRGMEGTTILDFQIFDRWGEMVYRKENFSVNDPTTGWNGEFRSKPMGSNVFVWYIVALHKDGTEEVLRGQTMLIR